VEGLDVSEQQAEQSGHQTSSLGAGSADPTSSDPRIDRLTVSGQMARDVESPDIVPDQDEAARSDDKALELKAETPNAEMPKLQPSTLQGFPVEAFKLDTPKPDMPEPVVPKPVVPKPDAPKGDASQAEEPKTDALNNDSPRPDISATEAVRAGSRRRPRELLIMSPGEHSWTRGEDDVQSGEPAPKPDMQGPIPGRRFAAVAAMLLLAVMAGAAGGALATVALSHPTETATAPAPQIATLEASVGRIDADVAALKAGLERTSAGLTQHNKTGDRLERVEKAQAEAAAKVARLGDAVDRLRAAGPAATTPVAAATPKDVTGTVTTSANAQALPTPQLQASPAPSPTAAGSAPKPDKPDTRMTEVGRLPTVESWVLRDVRRGVALIEGRGGLYEVFAGDPVPGLGRVDAIRKQDGRWVVVTSRGLIVAR
jgi:hypothetical protein